MLKTACKTFPFLRVTNRPFMHTLLFYVDSLFIHGVLNVSTDLANSYQ